MKKRYWIPALIIIMLVITWFSGPIPPKPNYPKSFPVLPSGLNDLSRYVDSLESTFPVREDNEARIVFNDSVPEKTEYAVIYLHGFAGSYRDAYPVNKLIADTLNANIYYARWAGHGLKPPHSLENFGPDEAWESAKQALAIGNLIGEKVIIMSTSTGGTLAIDLAAAYPEKVLALVNLSPNMEDDMPGTFVLNSPWGYEIAKLTSFGKNKEIEHEEVIAGKYWDTIYPSKALVDLQVLVETTMIPETFELVQCPVLTLYYRKNFMEKDEHVEVSVYIDAHKLFTTPDSLKILKPLPNPGTHFIGSAIKSKDIESVEAEIVKFLKDQLKIKISE